jgi:hypothetical protein
MLIEIWECLRGYNKWVRTEATIQSSTLQEPEAGKEWGEKRNYDHTYFTWQATCEIAWTDASGNSHTGKFVADERSSLFHLYEGQTVELRYNPANPDRFYIRGMLRTEPPNAQWRRQRIFAATVKLAF